MIAKLYNKHAQFVRYAIVGVTTNALGYLLYLAVTAWGGLSPKITMSLLYCTGVLIGFIGNYRWAFRHKGAIPASLLRYLLAHVGGYCINFMMLHVFSYTLHYPHQLVQAVAIIIVALYLFAAFKYFVFAEKNLGTRDD